MFITALIAFFFLTVGLIIGFALGLSTQKALHLQNAEPAGKPTPEATVEPGEAQLTNIRGEKGGIHVFANPEALDKANLDEITVGAELTRKPPPEKESEFHSDREIGEYIQVWYEKNFDVNKRKN